MDDVRAAIEVDAMDGNAVHSTVNSKGWVKVIKPALENRMIALVNDFANASVYEEFVRVQQAINAIKGLISFIEIKLVDGKSALEEIKEGK